MARSVSRSASRSLASCCAVILTTLALAAQAAAGSPWLPRVRLPKINLGKSVAAVAYPVTKSLVNGGKTVFKTAAAAETLGLMPNIGPPVVNKAAKTIIVTIGRH